MAKRSSKGINIVAKNKFTRIIREAVEDCYADFSDGNKLREMEEILHREIAMEAIRRTGKAKLSARRMGIGYERFRKIMGKDKT